MNEQIKQALAEHLLAMADDELILGHRNSEWTGHAPILEEDIGFTNIALDEIGHAALWYAARAELMGDDPDTHANQLIFFRSPEAYRNVQMVELPNGDWAFSILRQYLFDTYERVTLAALSESAFRTLSDVAGKISVEERYHERHSGAWVRRLGLGTEESHNRMQKALDALWAFALQLFRPQVGESNLVEAGMMTPSDQIKGAWQDIVEDHLNASGLQIPEGESRPPESRADHTDHLTILLEEMQEVARLEPGVRW